MTYLEGAGQFFGSAISRPVNSLTNDPTSAILAYRMAESRLLRLLHDTYATFGVLKRTGFSSQSICCLQFFYRRAAASFRLLQVTSGTVSFWVMVTSNSEIFRFLQTIWEFLKVFQQKLSISTFNEMLSFISVVFSIVQTFS